MTTPTESLRPLAWLCELAQEDGTVREMIVREDPDGLRFNDIGEPSPFKVTPLYALAQQPSAPSAEPADEDDMPTLQGIAEVVKQAHDECLDGRHQAARVMLRDVVQAIERLAVAAPTAPAPQPADPLGIPACGGPLCSDAHHHPLCQAGAAQQAVPVAASRAERRSAAVHAIVNAGPFPGMSEAFNAHMGAECWTDPDYAADASLWAAAFKAGRATLPPAEPAAPMAAAREPLSVGALFDLWDHAKGEPGSSVVNFGRAVERRCGITSSPAAQPDSKGQR